MRSRILSATAIAVVLGCGGYAMAQQAPAPTPPEAGQQQQQVAALGQELDAGLQELSAVRQELAAGEPADPQAVQERVVAALAQIDSVLDRLEQRELTEEAAAIVADIRQQMEAIGTELEQEQVDYQALVVWIEEFEPTAEPLQTLVAQAEGEEVETAEIVVQPQQQGLVIEQPEPQVDVQVPEPQVQVTQPEPQVRVTVPEPEVEVVVPEPEVQVAQPEPQVDVEMGQPRVQAQQTTPEIQAEELEPDVDVAVGEPQVDVQVAEPEVQVQTGEPQVETEVVGEEPEVAAVEPEAEVAPVEEEAELAPAEPDVEVEQPLPGDVAPDVTEEQPETAAVPEAAFSAEELMDQEVFTLEGEEVGSVEDVILDSTGQITSVVIEEGGFLGIGGRQVALDVEAISQDPEGRLVVNLSEQQIGELPDYEPEAGAGLAQ